VFDWHEANSFGWADFDNQSHPKKKTLGLFVPENNDASTGVCMWYENNHLKANKGKVIVNCDLHRQDQSVEKFKFSSKVRDNWVCACKTTGPVEVGDALLCSFTMKKFGKLRDTQEASNWVDLAAGIVPHGDLDWCG
jgi:hypothetical protein